MESGILIIILVLVIGGWWRIFSKAGPPGILSLIPILNIYWI